MIRNLLTRWTGRHRFPASVWVVSCPGAQDVDPFTGLVGSQDQRRRCNQAWVVEWAAGQSGAELCCTNAWCGWTGLVTRGPVEV